jgi:hypothetical protein
MMYRIEKFQRPEKTHKGYTGTSLCTKNSFKFLILAEYEFYDIILQEAIPINDKTVSYCIFDDRLNRKLAFFCTYDNVVYVKISEKNELGKYKYAKFSVPDFKKWIDSQKKNPFSQVI